MIFGHLYELVGYDNPIIACALSPRGGYAARFKDREAALEVLSKALLDELEVLPHATN